MRVGAPDGVGSYFLAPRLASLAERHPELTVQLVPLQRSFSLSRREADLAVTVDRPTEGRLVATKLVDYGVSLYASRDHLVQAGPIRAIGDVAGRTLITYVEDLIYSPALDYSKMLDHPAVRQFECASVVGQVEAVRGGVGIGLLHDYIAGRFPRTGTCAAGNRRGAKLLAGVARRCARSRPRGHAVGFQSPTKCGARGAPSSCPSARTATGGPTRRRDRFLFAPEP